MERSFWWKSFYIFIKGDAVFADTRGSTWLSLFHVEQFPFSNQTGGMFHVEQQATLRGP